MKKGGLGLRSISDHASAAFLSSVHSTQGLCTSIDKSFDTTDACGQLSLDAAIGLLGHSTLPDAHVDFSSNKVRQKDLSGLIDAKLQADLAARLDADTAFKTHLRLQTMHGAGAWLTANPSDDARTLDAPLFKIAIKRRLRMRVQDVDTFCPMCGGTMDSYGDHAIVCPCKGDRTIRHNRLRDIVYEDSRDANMGPEREKGGLLPGRPHDDGIHLRDAESENMEPETSRSLRRPADIYIPRAIGGTPTALDFACTSGMRSDHMLNGEQDTEEMLASYEQFKCDYIAAGETETTEALCRRQSIVFTPMVIEAHAGGWSKRARKIIDLVAKYTSSSCPRLGESASLSIAQRLSSILHRENSRAVLRRIQEPHAEAIFAEWHAGEEDPWW